MQAKFDPQSKLDRKSFLVGFFAGLSALFLVGATTDPPKRPTAASQHRLPALFSQGATVRYAGTIPMEREEAYPPVKPLRTFKIQQMQFEWALLRDEYSKSPNDKDVWVYLP